MSQADTAGERRVEVVEAHGGRVARLALTAPPGNALDLVLVADLRRAIGAVSLWPDLTAVVIEGAGRDFSIGYPTNQLRPPYATTLIEEFHAAVLALLNLDALLVSVVRGRCAGAGVALVLAADIVAADNTARLSLVDLADGAPAPLTTLLVAERLDRARAANALLAKKTFTGEEAAALHLVSDFAGGWQSAEAVVERHIEQLALPGSRAVMAPTVRALRGRMLARVAEALPDLQRASLQRLAAIAPDGS